jgi:predicted amidophosphoribosyltransferase
VPINFDRLDPKPAGFDNCPACAYRQGGSAEVCFTCAAGKIEHPSEDRCLICDQRLIMGACPNWVCRFDPDDRAFNVVWAIGMRSGALSRSISRYKYPPFRKGWATIFGRILVGYLDTQPQIFRQFDIISSSPSFPDAERDWDHTALVLQRAAIEAGGRWPFDLGNPRVIVATAATERFVGKKLSERKEIAEGPLRAALHVPNPVRVFGKKILVFDDVFTDGFRLREVARALKAAGALDVSGIVLARQPAPPDWGP